MRRNKENNENPPQSTLSRVRKMTDLSKDTSTSIRSNQNPSNNSSSSSLGILSLNSTDTSNLFTSKNDVSARLEHERKLAYKQLRNERKMNTSFIEGNSTNANKTQNDMLCSSIALFTEDFRNATGSIKDLCDKYCQSLSLSKEEFMPAEKAYDKLQADELSWRNQYDIMPKEVTEFSRCTEAIGEMSSGNFFLAKCQNLSALSLGRSPSNKSLPMPLLDSTIQSDCLERDVDDHVARAEQFSLPTSETNAEDSMLSLSKIAKMIHEVSTPGRCIKYLLNNDDHEKSNLELSSCQFMPQINSTLSEDLHMGVLREKTMNSIDTPSLKELSLPIRRVNEKENCNSDMQKRKPCGCNFTRELSPNTTISSNAKSIISTRSGSSLNSFPGGKIPIHVSNYELLWGHVKKGRKDVQQLIIKNKCQKRIHFLMHLSGSSYRILKDASGSDYETSLNVSMHPLETKSFNISFNPVKIGACVEKITFSPIGSGNSGEFKKLRLYGYGGHTNVEFDDVLKDSLCNMWLSLGKLNYDGILSKEITVKNTGTIPAFVSLEIVTKDIHFLSKPEIKTARNVVIAPNESTKVTFVYTPTRSDLKYLGTIQTSVVQIATLKIIHGSEAVRGRIRRLCNKLKKSNNVVGRLEEKLSQRFPHEHMPHDLNKFTETVGGMDTLLRQLSEVHILLTLEHNSDTTIIANANESTMFQSLFDSNETVLETTILTQPPETSYSVEPKSIVLTPPIKCEDNILIFCREAAGLQFHARVEPDTGIDINPRKGVLRSNDTIVIKVIYDNSSTSKSSNYFNVFVNVDNNVIPIDIKVVPLKTA